MTTMMIVVEINRTIPLLVLLVQWISFSPLVSLWIFVDSHVLLLLPLLMYTSTLPNNHSIKQHCVPWTKLEWRGALAVGGGARTKMDLWVDFDGCQLFVKKRYILIRIVALHIHPKQVHHRIIPRFETWESSIARMWIDDECVNKGVSRWLTGREYMFV